VICRCFEGGAEGPDFIATGFGRVWLLTTATHEI